MGRTKPELKISWDLAELYPVHGLPKPRGRRRKNETPVQFLTRMMKEFGACDVYFKRNGEFQKVER